MFVSHVPLAECVGFSCDLPLPPHICPCIYAKLSSLAYNLFEHRLRPGRAEPGQAFYAGLMWEVVVFPVMNGSGTDRIICRPASGSSRKRHKLLVLNPVSGGA